jgi:pyruvate dehydrogenase (quinone)
VLFRDLSLYTETISAPAQAAAVIHQAIGTAYAGRGVAHLTLPSDVLQAQAEAGVSSIATLSPLPEIVPTEAAIVEAAEAIVAANRIVIMCGAGCRGAAPELLALSDRLKAPLVHSVKGQDIMPHDDPHWIGGIGMIGTKAVYNAVKKCDLFLMLGTDYPYSNFLPSDATVLQIDDRARVLGRRAPTRLGIVGSVRPALRLLLGRVAAKADGEFFEEVNAARRKWEVMLGKQADLTRSADRIHPQAVARVQGGGVQQRLFRTDHLRSRSPGAARLQEGHRIS